MVQHKLLKLGTNIKFKLPIVDTRIYAAECNFLKINIQYRNWGNGKNNTKNLFFKNKTVKIIIKPVKTFLKFTY